MEQIIDRLLRWIKRGYAPPLRVELNPTNRCNSLCRFCSLRTVNNLDYKDELTREELLDIVDQAHQLGVKQWMISGGGEPLWDQEKILAVMERIKSYRMFGELITNGTRFYPELIRKLVEIKWDVVNLSLQGPNAEIHDYLTNNPGAFDLNTKAMECFKKFKEESRSPFPQIIINTIVMNRNYRHMEGFIHLAKKYDLFAITIKTLDIVSPEGPLLQLSPEEQSEFSQMSIKLKKIADSYGIANNFEDYFAMRLADEKKYQIEKLESEELGGKYY